MLHHFGISAVLNLYFLILIFSKSNVFERMSLTRDVLGNWSGYASDHFFWLGMDHKGPIFLSHKPPMKPIPIKKVEIMTVNRTMYSAFIFILHKTSVFLTCSLNLICIHRRYLKNKMAAAGNSLKIIYIFLLAVSHRQKVESPHR